MRYQTLFAACLALLVASCTEPPKKESTALETGAAETEAQLVARALAIHDRVLTMDTHADTPLRMIEPGFDMSVRHDPNESGSKVDYPRMIEGGLDSIFFATFVAQNIRDDEGDSRAKALAMQMIDATIESTLANADTVGLALTPDDAIELERQGKRAVYIAMENGYPIGSDLANVEVFYDKGVRYITLVHSTNNDLADSSTDSKGPEHEGLSQFGEEVVKEMNRLGIMIDVSHASDDVFYDTIALSEAPIIATHSNARAVTEHKRNMSDDMITTIAEHGGVVQVTMYSGYLRAAPGNPKRDAAIAAARANMKPPSEMTDDDRAAMRETLNEINQAFPDPLATVQHAVDHIDYIVSLVGIDHVGIGCDFDGGGGIEGVFDASEVMNITIELVRRGYTEEEIGKIWSGNVLRVFREVQALAEQKATKAAI
ncbi:MAG: membrane dipeptidase [Gammaproteobacteria bacterium]|jgi:membrane dipeptidase|nr:membrane dipeptidase [Gammaproteobacteria bacterium]